MFKFKLKKFLQLQQIIDNMYIDFSIASQATAFFVIIVKILLSFIIKLLLYIFLQFY